ncbi:hypothetical protein MA9V1_152 [Chryseobacterium phage MA9V-1]|nr:hypothetical protein MA9V1_152 [Chryseobacterium phage MA9V-1]
MQTLFPNANQVSNMVDRWSEFINEAAPKGGSTLSDGKRAMIAQVAEFHAHGKDIATGGFLNESIIGTNIMSNGANMNGMGSITLPTNVKAGFTQFNQQTPGSGDVPVTVLSMAMSVAATTIGFDLLPTIPIYQPAVMLQYVDYLYGGGKLDSADNPPLIVMARIEELRGHLDLRQGSKVAIHSVAGDATSGWTFEFVGFTRLEGYATLKVDTFANKVTPALGTLALVEFTIDGGAPMTIAPAGNPKLELARAVENHFSMFTAYGNLDGEGVDRAEAEKGTRSVIEMRTYSKVVRTKEHAVEGIVSRQQARDIKAMGLDAFPQLKVAMQNDISQSLNKEILMRMRQMGVSTHLMLQKSQGVNLNTYIDLPANTSKPIVQFKTSPLIDKNGVNQTANFLPAPNSETNSAAENLWTRQRRVTSTIITGAALVGQASFHGSADAVVVNSQLMAAIKESVGYQPATIENKISQSTKALYYAGTISDVAVYCDPNMKWNDTTAILARTGKTDDGLDINQLAEGLVFLPYVLSSEVEIITEGTMGPKALIETVYAIGEIGIRPELAYLTIVFDNGFGRWA